MAARRRLRRCGERVRRSVAVRSGWTCWRSGVGGPIRDAIRAVARRLRTAGVGLSAPSGAVVFRDWTYVLTVVGQMSKVKGTRCQVQVHVAGVCEGAGVRLKPVTFTFDLQLKLDL